MITSFDKGAEEISTNVHSTAHATLPTENVEIEEIPDPEPV
jgi:hypothetical protein